MGMEESNKELIPLSLSAMIETALTELESIREIKISSDEENTAASVECQKLTKLRKDLEAKKLEVTKEWRDKVATINGAVKTVVDKTQNGENALRRAMSTYYQEQERKRKEAERKAQAEAEEARRKAEEAARKEAEKAAQYREQGREEMAEKAEARAEAKIETASTIVAPVIEAKKVAGISFREEITVQVTDEVAAKRYCSSDPMLTQCVSLDTAAIKRIRKAVPTLKIDGISFAIVKTPVVRS
jgi:hypothetical protein